MAVAQANEDVFNVWRPEDEARVQADLEAEQQRIEVFDVKIETSSTTSLSSSTESSEETAAAAETAAEGTRLLQESAADSTEEPAAEETASVATTPGVAVIEYDKDSVFNLSDQYDPINDSAVVSFSNQVDLERIADEIEAREDLHEDDEDNENAGAIAALIIGTIILVGMLAFCMWKACNAKKSGGMGMSSGGARSGNNGTIMINQSAMSSNTNQGKLDDIM